AMIRILTPKSASLSAPWRRGWRRRGTMANKAEKGASPGARADFLAPHHLEAAARFEALFRRAQLSPRLTMSYDPAHVGGRRRSDPGTTQIGDSAAEARLLLSRIAGRLPAECWGVLFDVCGLGKGLQ